MTIGSFKGNLITAGTNAKTVKGDGREYVTAIMYLAPAENVAGVNLCPMAKLAGCETACLYKAGRGVMSNVEAGRVRKTVWYRDDRASFMKALYEDLIKFTVWSNKRGVRPVVRLNGTSDIRWERESVTYDGVTYPNVFAAFPAIQFYDYTKLLNRKVEGLHNYHLTLSYSGANVDYASRVVSCARARSQGLAVVFRNADVIPATFKGLPVVDGDADDLRFLDPDGAVVVALYAKGPAKRDTSGFVVDPS